MLPHFETPIKREAVRDRWREGDQGA